jgi:hypothetical protein
MSNALDFAQAQYRERWLHHYAIGDPSWDTFVREAGNPIHTGASPYEWPVNGFLFHDPPTGDWYAYVGLYPRGYWPAGPCLTMRETQPGQWETLGLAIQGDPQMFDGDDVRGGAMPDVSLVYANGRYHMVYDWANPANTRGGLAYAWADSPAGPFHRAAQPIHEDTYQAPILNRYVRAYGGTLIQRAHDWIVVHAMSTPGNAGGTWAMACMTAPRPEGPYTEPRLLLYPQSATFLPPFMEYYPAFVYEGYLYAPATSVARNRNFQCIFHAPLEQAHLPEAWEIYQHGSVWHAESDPAEAQGIWGQTFSAQVSPAGTLRAYFTCKTQDDVGTVHLARRPWATPYQDGFVLGAPNMPSYAILRQHYTTFILDMQVRANSTWSLSWQSQSPLGPNTPGWDPSAHPLMYPQHAQWQRSHGDWKLTLLDEVGEPSRYAGYHPSPTSGSERIQIVQDATSVSIILNDQPICVAKHPALPGRLQLVAEKGTCLHVDEFQVEGETGATPATEFWLATEGLAGAGTGLDEIVWQRVEDLQFRYGVGYVNQQTGARVKWNYRGEGFSLHAPCGPNYGKADVWVDGQRVTTLDFHLAEPARSAVVFSQALPMGYHAVILQAIEGIVPCDVLEVNAPVHPNE